MSSLITSLSSITSGSPKSSDFYSRLKSILSPATFNENFSKSSTTSSFSDWKRKVRCLSDSDYVMQPKLENQEPRNDYMESEILKYSPGISTKRSDGHLNSSYILRFLPIDPISPHKGSSNVNSKKSSPHDLYPLTCSQQIYYHQAQIPRYSNIHSLPVLSTSVFQTKSQTENAITTSKTFDSLHYLNNATNNPIVSDGNKIAACKKSSSGHRKNIWKNQTYADLICKAILSSPGKRLTLSQIYDWLIENIDYFKVKKDGKSSIGWKNSIRHNLSLHSRFVRIQGHESGKSSWWTVDLTAKSSRRCKRKTLLADSSKAILRLPSTSTLGSQLPPFLRYQMPYDGYVANDRFHPQNSFYQQGKESWLYDYNSHKTFPAQNVAGNDKSSFPSCYFPYSDPYSCCYSNTFLSTTFVPASSYTFGSNDNNYSYYYNRATNDDKSITRYLPSNHLNQYNDYFNIRSSTGFQLSDSSTSLPMINVNNRNGIGGSEHKTLPSLFSTLYNNLENNHNNNKVIQHQVNLDQVGASNYDYRTPSRYDHNTHKIIDTSNYNLKKHPSSSGFMDGLKVNHSETYIFS